MGQVFQNRVWIYVVLAIFHPKTLQVSATYKASSASAYIGFKLIFLLPEKFMTSSKCHSRISSLPSHTDPVSAAPPFLLFFLSSSSSICSAVSPSPFLLESLHGSRIEIIIDFSDVYIKDQARILFRFFLSLANEWSSKRELSCRVCSEHLKGNSCSSRNIFYYLICLWRPPAKMFVPRKVRV